MHNFKTNEIITCSAALILIPSYSTHGFFPCLSHADNTLPPPFYIYIKPHTNACFSHPIENVAVPWHAGKLECTNSRTLCHGHGHVSLWAHRSQNCAHILLPGCEHFQSYSIQLWDQRDTNPFIAIHNLMGPRRYWWIYSSSEQLKDTTKGHGYFDFGFGPPVNMNPT